MGRESDRDRLFQRRRPGEQKAPYWRLVRTPANRALVGICLSGDLVGCPIHYVGNRSVPCWGQPECTVDHFANPPRWKYYIGASINPDGEKVIVEMTDAVEHSWDEAFCLYRTLRGIVFELKRRDGKNNGKLFLRTKPRKGKLSDLPQAPDIEQMLMRIWEVPDLLRGDSPLSLTPLERRQRRTGEA